MLLNYSSFISTRCMENVSLNKALGLLLESATAALVSGVLTTGLQGLVIRLTTINTVTWLCDF